MATTKKKAAQAKKLFTVQQANAMLPLVRAIVRDIVELARDLKERQERVTRLQPNPESVGLSDAHHEELREVRRSLLQDKQRMREYAAELADLGVELKDPVTGLVDFPSLHEGREVCLCWMEGEAEIRHWHDREAGFAGRQPLPR